MRDNTSPLAHERQHGGDSHIATAAGPALLRVENLVKEFHFGGSTVKALRSVSFTLQYGRFIAIRGRSGAGKTTLLNLIAGLDDPTEGHIWLSGKDIGKLSESERTDLRRSELGFVFQSAHLFPSLTARENVEVPLRLAHTPREQRQRRSREALALVGLTDRLKHRPGQLSGGQQQRVGIARAIVTDPTLIVADEPTGDLDARSAEEILNLLVELQRGLQKTILMVTHDPRAAARAQRILHLEKGQLVRETAPV